MQYSPTPLKHLPTAVVAFDYARLSKNRKKLSNNVAIQHRESFAYLDDQGWEHGGSFEDDDISASKYSTKPRPGYDDLINAISQVKDRPNAVVRVYIVVTEMPRLYRRMEELLGLIQMAEHTNLSGIWTTDGEGYDLSTPEGIHRAIGAVNNAMLESNRMSKRQKRKKAAQAAEGKPNGSRRYGFAGPAYDEHGNVTNKGSINIDEIPEEIEHWLSWFSRLVAGEAQSSIIKDNNAQGIPSTNGGRWTVGNFKRLMLKKAYVIYDGPEPNPDQRAICEHNGVEYKAQWRGLITRSQYELLVAALEARAQHWDHGLTNGRKYLLTGQLFCGGTFRGEPCPGVMFGNGRKLAKRYQRRYCCKCFNNQLEHVACGKVFRDAEALDCFIKEAVLYRLDTPQVAAALATQDDSTQAEALARQLIELKNRRSLIRKQYARGAIASLAEYNEIKTEVDRAIEEAEVACSKARSAHAAKLLPVKGPVREAWERAEAAGNLAWERSIINLVIEKIIVHPHPRQMRWNGFVFDPEAIEIRWRH